jgi:hypothetical protein
MKMKVFIFIVTAFLLSFLLLQSSERINFYSHGFIKNVGQLLSSDDVPCNEVLYYRHTQEKSIYLTKNKIIYVFYDQSDIKNVMEKFASESENSFTTNAIRIDIEFMNISENLEIIEGNTKSENLIYHYAKSTQNSFRTSNCNELTYNNIYDGVDLTLNIDNDFINFTIKADDPKDIRRVELSVTPSASCSLSNNNISVEVFEKEEVLFSPKVNINGINYSFSLKDEDDKLLMIPSDKKNVLKDIEFKFGTYIGGGNTETFRDVSADMNGNYIVTGYSLSYDFPVTSGAYQTQLRGDVDIVACYFSKDNTLLWTTYIGGRNSDSGFGSAIDSEGNIWISGQTTGDFPRTDNAYQKSYQGGSADAVLLKLSDSGNLLFSTNFGGNAYEALINICVDEDDIIFGATETRSENFPVTPNAYQKTKGRYYDGYLLKCDNDGNVLLLTFYGGDYDDSWDGIAIAKDGNPVVGGWSQSTNLKGRLNNRYGLTDAFIAKLDKNTGEPIWGTYIGGSDYDRGFNLTSDHNGDFIITGVTSSVDFPVSDGFYPKMKIGGTDYFFAKVSDEGQVIYSSYFGGNGDDGIQDDYSRKGGVAVDSKNNFFISGFTLSHDFPVKDLSGFESDHGDIDSFISVFSENGDLQWSGYIGGNAKDEGYDVCYDNNGQYIIIGTSSSTDFPTTDNAYQQQNNGQYDGFIVKFGEKDTSSCDESYFEYPDFSEYDKLNFVGNAFQYEDFIRLNSSGINKTGAMWRAYKVPVKKGFTTKFNFSMSEGENGVYDDGSAPGADGIAFVIQNEQKRALGIWGGGIGYHNIKNSFAVEFDTFANDSLQIENFFDPNGNHIAVMCNGTNPNSSRHNSDAQIAVADDIIEIIPDGRKYYAKIDYNIEPNVMNIYLSDDMYFGEPALRVENIDISSMLDLDNSEFAWVGFTSATGNSYENHDIHYWYFCPVPTEAVVSVENHTNEKSEHRCYPNPFSDELTVEMSLSRASNVSISICDLLCRKLVTIGNQYYEPGDHTFHIDTEMLSAGIYFLKITKDDVVNHIKVVCRGK